MDKIDEYINLTSGQNMWEFTDFDESIERPIRVSDGPTGLRYVTNSCGTVDELSENATCFPSECACANTFNTDLLYKMGNALGEDCKNKNVDILLAPGINIKRIPHCGRNFEYYSEDPYLTGVLASSLVSGVQDKGVGCCIKHFVANNSEAFRFTNSSIVDERALNEIYLYPFKYVIEHASPVAIMTSYNRLNNIYVSENKNLLDKVRSEFGFKGLFISDWGGVSNPVKALKAGLNIEMPGNHYSKDIIKEAYFNKEINDQELEDNAKIIKYNFDKLHKMRGLNVSYKKDFSKEVAYEVAKEAPVLLKNNDVLPLNKNDRILICGDLFNNPNTQGSGSSKITYKNKYSFEDEFLKFNKNIVIKQGYHKEDIEDLALIEDCIESAKYADKIVVFAGYIYGDCEGVDRDNLDLPHNQLKLIGELAKLNKKIIVVINTGSIVHLPFNDEVDGILYTTLLGQWHEKVVTETLFGKINPSGKLSETIPYNFNELKLYDDIHCRSDVTLYNESIYVGYRYYDTFNKKSLYPFGYGLSYSKFEFSNINLSRHNNQFIINFDLKNNSDIDGKEVCEVYIKKINSKTYHPLKELKAIKKIEVKSNEKINVEISLDEHSLEFYNDLSHKFEVENCEYEFLLGNSSDNLYSCGSIIFEGEQLLTRLNKDSIPSYYSNSEINKNEFIKIYNQNINYNDYNILDMDTPLIYYKKNNKALNLYNELKEDYIKQNTLIPNDLAEKAFNYMPIRIISNWTNGLIKYHDAEKLVKDFNKNNI